MRHSYSSVYLLFSHIIKRPHTVNDSHGRTELTMRLFLMTNQNLNVLSLLPSASLKPEKFTSILQ